MCGMNLRRFCEEWRIWIRPLLLVTYVIFAIIVVPLLIVNSVKDGFSHRDQLILIAGLFVLSTLPVSVWHIIQHVIHFTKPILQKHIIRILWMVPIYALNAWIGLWFPKHSIYVDSLRECYEAYVIYNFMVYLLNYLNLSMDLEATMEFKPQVGHIFPLCCLRPWTMGREFIHNCKHGILQYTVVRPITTFISVICELSGVYGEGTFAGNVAFPYIVVVNNISQFVAMYCLALFYIANKEDLKPMKPFSKFLCIKAVVFFSFFQGFLLNLLVYYGYIKDIFGTANSLEDNENLASLLQNFLICIEMFIAAVAHMYSFPHYPFHINSPQYWNNPNNNWWRAILSMIDITDMQEDVTEHLGVVSSSISRHFQGRTTYQPLSRGGTATRRTSSSENEYLINKRHDGDGSSQSSDLSQVPNVQILGGSSRNHNGDDRDPSGRHYSNFNNNKLDTGNNKAYNTNIVRPMAKANSRYGATDKLLLPVNDENGIIRISTSQFPIADVQLQLQQQQQQLYTSSATADDAGTSSTAHAGAFTSSVGVIKKNSAGINIQQKSEPKTATSATTTAAKKSSSPSSTTTTATTHPRQYEYSTHYGAPIEPAHSFLHARNIAGADGDSSLLANIPESNGEFSSFVGDR